MVNRRKKVIDLDASQSPGPWRLADAERALLDEIVLEKITCFLETDRPVETLAELTAAHAEIAKLPEPSRTELSGKLQSLKDIVTLVEEISRNIETKRKLEALGNLSSAENLKGKVAKIGDTSLEKWYAGRVKVWGHEIDKIPAPDKKPPPPPPDVAQQGVAQQKVMKLLDEVESHEKNHSLEKARGSLEGAGKLLSQVVTRRDTLERRVKLWQCILDIDEEKRGGLEKAWASFPEDKPWPDEPKESMELLEHVAKFVLRANALPVAADIEKAIGVMWSARQPNHIPAMSSDLAELLAQLWAKRVECYAQTEEPAPPGKQQFDNFESEWGKLEDNAKQGLPLNRRSYIDAWQCECLLRCIPDDANALGRAKAIPLPAKDVVPYVAYVRAMQLQAGAADPPAILDELLRVFPQGKGPLAPELANVPKRLERAANCAISVAEKLRPKRGPKLFGALLDPAAAQRSYQLLKAVNADKSALRRLGKAEHRQFQFNLALAAMSKEPPDFPTAQTITAELVKLDDDKGPEAFNVLDAYLRSREHGPAEDPAELVKTCTRLTRLVPGRLGKNGRLWAEDASDFVKRVREPGRAAAKQVRGQVLADFFTTVAGFIWDHKYADWPDKKNLNTLLEDLFTAAIRASPTTGAPPSLADCHVRRGQLLLDRNPPPLATIIDDANAAKDIVKPLHSHSAHGLLADAYLRRGRTRATRADLLKDLTTAIAEAESAVNCCPQTDTSSKAGYLITLSDGCVELANYNMDAEYQRSRAAFDLDKAIAYAEQAAGLSAGQPDYPYLALGNAYEDLAWLAEKDPKENYKRAIDNFREAAKLNPLLAQPYCSIGRCYYRALVDTCLDPPDLGKRDAEAVYDECVDNLTQAIQRQNDLVEAYASLGSINQRRAGDLYANDEKKAKKCFLEADENCLKAKNLAEKQDLPHRAFYVITWAEFPLCEKRYDETKKRLRQIELAGLPPPPPGGYYDPKKEMARIEGDILRLQGDDLCSQGNYVEATKKYDEAVKKYDSLIGKGTVDSDQSLLWADASCRNAWAMELKEELKKVPPLPGASQADVITLLTGAADNAERAGQLAVSRSSRFTALKYALQARRELYAATRDMRDKDKVKAKADYDKAMKADYDEAMEDVRRLTEALPRRPGRDEVARKWIRLIISKIYDFDLARTAKDEKACLDDFSSAILWQDKVVEWSTPEKVGAEIEGRKALVNEAVTEAGTIQNDTTLPQPLRDDAGKRAAEWQKRLQAPPAAR